MKLTIAQKKSVIVFSRHNDLLDLTTPGKERMVVTKMKQIHCREMHMCPVQIEAN